MPKYINPYTDFGFKKLFGEEANKEVLMDFLNQMLPPIHQIVSLTLKNPERLPDAAKERKAFFDIECMSIKGEAFIVEMQKAKVKYFKDRALFYTTFPIREQAKKGADWNFELKPIYFIAILDFFYDEQQEKAKFFRDVKLTDQENEVFYEKLQFKFLQMPAFTKTESELETHFDKWIYFLKNLENFEAIPTILKEPVFERAFETARLANFSSKQRAAYEKSRLDYYSVKAVAETAREEALIEGEEKGRIEGRIEGKEERDIELIIDFSQQGMTAQAISNLLKIQIEKVQQVIGELSKN